MLLLQLYWSFFMVGIFCVGGGYASMPLIQAQVITQHNWITMQEFMDIFAISQMTPGPIGINAATFVGTKIAGLPGAIMATMGFVTPSLIIMIVLARLFFKYGNVGALRGILNGLRPAVVALLASALIVFLNVTLWGSENSSINIKDIDIISLVVLITAFMACRSKTPGVIQTLAASGILNLVLHLIAK
ncbi:MAG: chromate transporter [Phascolarctobacterium sp.]|nr:chromate transporter [Phascolarctobacterium sp.]